MHPLWNMLFKGIKLNLLPFLLWNLMLLTAAEISVLCVSGCVGGWALYSPCRWLCMFYRRVREV